LQHGAGTDGPPLLRYPMHGAMVSCIWPHERAPFAKGMHKTKHIIAMKVTFMSIELAMIDSENLREEIYIALQVCEWIL
jgi:hypothetical protein